jgi:uncharacterized protein YwqG
MIEEKLAQKPGYTRARFLEQLNKLSDEDAMYSAGHSFGGWPNLIQAPMELECQLVTHGIYVGGPEAYADPRAAGLSRGAVDWRLLLQLDSDDGLNWMWGDAGMLYFSCREQDMAEGKFDRSWTILQCT